jgi:hypothetical protein
MLDGKHPKLVSDSADQRARSSLHTTHAITSSDVTHDAKAFRSCMRVSLRMPLLTPMVRVAMTLDKQRLHTRCWHGNTSRSKQCSRQMGHVVSDKRSERTSVLTVMAAGFGADSKNDAIRLRRPSEFAFSASSSSTTTT